MDWSADFCYQETIIEGFICPTCLKAFVSPQNLEDHFSRTHVYCNAPNVPSLGSVIGLTLGKIRSHTDDFDKLRRAKVNRTTLETNLLLIRLEKISNIPKNLDVNRRHAMEQSIVPWIGAKVDLCPRCGSRFGLSWPVKTTGENDALSVTPNSSTNSFSYHLQESIRSASRLASALIDNNPVYRGIHHCRLCGHIICGDCSCFLTEGDVALILKSCNLPSIWSSQNNLFSSDSYSSSEESRFKSGIQFMSRSTSGSSLNSLSQKKRQSQNLRLCEVCKSLLELKMQLIGGENALPIVFEQFQTLKNEMNKIKEKMPIFYSMASSLNSGEEKYILEMARSLRSEILHRLQKIDELGKQFGSLGNSSLPKDQANPSLTAQDRINRSVCQFARRFVQNNLLPLRILPNECEYRRLTQKRANETAEGSSVIHVDGTPLTVGWMPTTRKLVSTGTTTTLDDRVICDPRVILMRQMDMVADYLSQAKAANRSPEDIRILTENLSELELELSLAQTTDPLN